MVTRVFAFSLPLTLVLATACGGASPDAQGGGSSSGEQGSSGQGGSSGEQGSSGSPGPVDCHELGTCGEPDAECRDGSECGSGVCVDARCAEASATDGVKNGDETDIDCGGSSAPACAPGGRCQNGADCTQKVCTSERCAEASATDGIKNGDETDVDCGGATAPACAPNRACLLGPDCVSAICIENSCTTPSHDDQVKNGDETDVDCGGATAPRCAVDARCVLGGDCVEGVCAAGTCAAPTHQDQVKNGDETGVDCGGPTAPACGNGQGCAQPTDCRDLVCTNALCIAATALDGVKNGGETDVDCGGPNAPACAPGASCVGANDCRERVCVAEVCQAPRYDDGVKNGDETDVDCGGPNAPLRCAVGGGCGAASDCGSAVCQNQLCQAPRYDDGVKNGDETGIDCGGPNAPLRCAVGGGCLVGGDCVEQVCNAATSSCAAPSFTDGVKNGTETDVDCGGPAALAAQRCALEQTCAANSDCRTGGCGDGRCTYPSCGRAESAGLRTCGAGEVGQAGAQHENCCRSLPLPNVANRRLDKYEITSGRMRSFVTAINATHARGQGNVRAWAQAFTEANPTSQLARMFNSAPTLRNLLPASYNEGNLSTIAHLGVIDMDNYGGIRGCYMGDGSYGSATYWLPPDDLARYGVGIDTADGGRRISQANLDAKSLSCATPLMLAAFCAWDGGELALQSELLDAWGPSTFPWGANDIGRPQYNWCNGRYGTGGFNCQNTALGNNGIFYGFPLGGLNGGELDLAYLIAAPGRLPGDASSRQHQGESWRDLFANLGEYTGDFSAPSYDFCDFSGGVAAGATTCTRSYKNGTGTYYTGVPGTLVVGRSWEGHDYGRGSGWLQAMFQYSKFGGRCARPL